MKKNILFIVIAVIITFNACEDLLLDPETSAPPAPKIYESRLATILDSLRYACKLPALAGAIITEKGIDFAAVGSRIYCGQANVTNIDKFHLGSCGKSFTSVLIGTLVDEGLLKWNSTLLEIFPEYANTMREEFKPVTVQDLLSHSAGFIRDYKISLTSSTAKDNRAAIVKWALMQKPAQQRGKFLYSNLGYLIAGAITERITNRTYEELLVERVIKPLGLTTAGFGPMGAEGKEDQPLQHTPNHAPIIATPNATLDPVYNPAGGLHMSIEDWGKYIQWILTFEANKYQNILKPETARKITTGITPEGNGWFYSFGWGVSNQEWAGGKNMNHSGSNGFNYSTAWVFSDKHSGIVLMTNQGAIGEEWLLEKPFWRLFDYYKKGI